MPSIAYLTTRLPSTIANELINVGYRVLEAFEVSEIMYLCEHENIDTVVIEADVEHDENLLAIQTRRITLRLKPQATAKDVLFELSTLFPAKIVPIQ